MHVALATLAEEFLQNIVENGGLNLDSLESLESFTLTDVIEKIFERFFGGM